MGFSMALKSDRALILKRGQLRFLVNQLSVHQLVVGSSLARGAKTILF